MLSTVNTWKLPNSLSTAVDTHEAEKPTHCYLFIQQCGSFLTEAEERQPDKRSILLARSTENLGA